jgi:hypothetical protein
MMSLLFLFCDDLPAEKFAYMCLIKHCFIELQFIKDVTVSGDEEVAMSIFDGAEVMDHQVEEAQKGTPVLPHFQYTRVSFKLLINRNRLTHFQELIVYRVMHGILCGSLLKGQSGAEPYPRLDQFSVWVC